MEEVTASGINENGELGPKGELGEKGDLDLVISAARAEGFAEGTALLEQAVQQAVTAKDNEWREKFRLRFVNGSNISSNEDDAKTAEPPKKGIADLFTVQ